MATKKKAKKIVKKSSPVKKKKITKKPIKKKAAVKKLVVRKAKKAVKIKAKKTLKKPLLPKIEGTIVGKITHYFPHVQAAVIEVTSTLKTGDTIRIKGHTTDFKENITSMQIDHATINEAKPKDEIGLLVSSRVRIGDTVYKI